MNPVDGACFCQERQIAHQMPPPFMEHHLSTVNGIRMHYVQTRVGTARNPPLVLLHGWPEFWYVWHRNIPDLSRHFDLIVPDLRGFGETEKPPDLPKLNDHVADLVGLLDHIGVKCAGFVSHDVGAHIAQAFALAHPDRVTGLFFSDCPYPGIGRRWVENGHANQIWYQSFQQLPLASELVGSSRENCRAYLKHFLDNWAASPGRFDKDLEKWVENFMKPGNLEGGFNWYKAGNKERLRQIGEGAQPRAIIHTRARFLWGARDPIIPPHWCDGLDSYFSDYTFETCEDAGHFVFYEQPDKANAQIIDFFLG